MSEKPTPEPADESQVPRFQRTVENLLKTPPKPHKAPAEPDPKLK